MNRPQGLWTVAAFAALCAAPPAAVGPAATNNTPPVADVVPDASAGAAADAGAGTRIDAGTPPPTGPQNTVYVSFIINVHDWVFPENSIATLKRIIDLHERYQRPVDLYLTDPVTQIYVAQAPDLISRLKTSPYVTISHHTRAPAPYYPGFDWAGLASLSGSALAAKLLTYEEHRIDLSTGETTADEGGFEYMKKLFGYAPYVVSHAAEDDAIAKALAALYKAKGAKFTLVHSDQGTAWGEQRNGLFMRPETVEVKAYERLTDVDFEREILAPAMATVGATRPAFINLKWHDDNFTSSQSPWLNVYYTVTTVNGQRRFRSKPRPWDISAFEPVTKKTAAEKEIQWRRYETALQKIIAQPETYTAVGIRDIARMAGLE